MATQSKPMGLTLIALNSALVALITVPVGCTASIVGQVPGVGDFALFFGFLVTLLGLLSCAAVYGLWTLQEWGRSLAYWLYFASVPLGVISIFPPIAGPTATAGNTVLQFVWIAIDLFIIAYLAKPEVMQLFSDGEVPGVTSVTDRREPY